MAKVELEDNSFATREKVAIERERDKETEHESVEKAIKGTAYKKKKTLGRKLLDYILGEDMNKVEDYVKNEVIRPGAMNLIFDIAMSTLSMALFGEARYSRGRDRESSRSRRRSYDTIYDERRERERTRARRPSYDIEDIIFETRDDAEIALDRLERILEKYGVARVSDLNAAAGVTGTWTDKNFGWTDLRGVRIIGVAEGYIIDFPPCEDVR